MNVVLTRHCAKYIYILPDGIKELMSDISREVLRSQPSEIYIFIADYLDALMITRENARVAASVVDNLTDVAITTAEFLMRTGMSREEADRVARIIQEAFRRHMAVKLAATQTEQVDEVNLISGLIEEMRISPEQAEEAASIIQSAYRNFKQKREREKSLLIGMVDWRVAARSAIHLYRKTGVTVEEANRAATLIKAAYKGYYTRRVMKRLLDEADVDVEEAEEYSGEYGQEYYWGEEEEEEKDDEDKDREKSVRINFETVIPHVDFDEAKVKVITDVEEESESVSPDKSTVTGIVSDILDNVLDSCVGQSDDNEPALGEGGPSVGDTITSEDTAATESGEGKDVPQEVPESEPTVEPLELGNDATKDENAPSPEIEESPLETPVTEAETSATDAEVSTYTEATTETTDATTYATTETSPEETGT